MTRSLMLAGALALALPSLALSSAALAQPASAPAPADPSNPAGAPLSPSLGSANQPARGDDSRVVRDAEVQAGTAATDTETEADRQAREEAAKPKATRTVRMGERTMSTARVASR